MLDQNDESSHSSRPAHERGASAGDRKPERESWTSAIPETAARLFLSLPQHFTLAEVTQTADDIGQPYTEALGYIRLFRCEEMVAMRGNEVPELERYAKTGRVT